jgi:tetratricopeptide (TPR) repeat protein
VDEAQQQLEKAAEELAWSSAAPDDIASNDLALARSLLLRGDPETALELSNRAYDAIVEVSPLVAAEAKAVQGLAHAGRGASDEALSAYQQAVHILTGVGADRAAAQLWFELADLLEQLGEYDASRLAYRSAAASAGVRSRSTATTAAVVAAPAHPVS